MLRAPCVQSHPADTLDKLAQGDIVEIAVDDIAPRLPYRGHDFDGVKHRGVAAEFRSGSQARRESRRVIEQLP